MIRAFISLLLLIGPFAVSAQVALGGAIGVSRLHTKAHSDWPFTPRPENGSTNLGLDIRVYGETWVDSVGFARVTIGYGTRHFGYYYDNSTSHFSRGGADLDVSMQLMEMNVGYSFPIRKGRDLSFRIDVGPTLYYATSVHATGRGRDGVMQSYPDSTGAVVGYYPSSIPWRMDDTQLDVERLGFGAELGFEALMAIDGRTNFFLQNSYQGLWLRGDGGRIQNAFLTAIAFRAGVRFEWH